MDTDPEPKADGNFEIDLSEGEPDDTLIMNANEFGIVYSDDEDEKTDKPKPEPEPEPDKNDEQDDDEDEEKDDEDDDEWEDITSLHFQTEDYTGTADGWRWVARTTVVRSQMG